MQPNFKYCSSTYFDDYTHIQIFTDASLLDFLEAYGFKVIRSVPRFMPVNMKSTLRLNLPMLPLIVRTVPRVAVQAARRAAPDGVGEPEAGAWRAVRCAPGGLGRNRHLTSTP